jgi:hypothetical protein
MRNHIKQTQDNFERRLLSLPQFLKQKGDQAEKEAKIRTGIINELAAKNGRHLDHIDQSIGMKCWRLHLHHNRRFDKDSKIVEDCPHDAHWCNYSHANPEFSTGEELERMKRAYHLFQGKRPEKKKQRARGRKGKGGETDKAKDDGTGSAYGAVQQYRNEAGCNTCENGTQNYADYTEGGANEGGTRSGQPADTESTLRDVADAAIAKYIENLKSGARSGQPANITAMMREEAAAVVAKHFADLRR